MKSRESPDKQYGVMFMMCSNVSVTDQGGRLAKGTEAVLWQGL